MCALSCHLFLLEWSEGVWAVLSFLRLSISLSLFLLVWSNYFPPRQLLALLKFLWVALKMKLVIANISRKRAERLTSALLLFCLAKKKNPKSLLKCLWDFLTFKRTSWTLQSELKKKLDFETSHAQVCQRLTLKAESITSPLSLGLAPQNRFFHLVFIFKLQSGTQPHRLPPSLLPCARWAQGSPGAASEVLGKDEIQTLTPHCKSLHGWYTLLGPEIWPSGALLQYQVPKPCSIGVVNGAWVCGCVSVFVCTSWWDVPLK